MALELPEIIRKQTKEEERKTAQLKAQLEIQRAQNELRDEQQVLASIRISQRNNAKFTTESIKKLEVQKGIQEKLLEINKAKAKYEREILDLQNEQNRKVRQRIEIQAKARAEAGIGNMRADISRVQSERADQQFFPGLSSRA